MSLQKSLTILCAIFALAACGPSLKTITLITPIPVMNPTKDLMKLFSNTSQTLLSGPNPGVSYCHQTEIRAGFRVGNDGPVTLVPVSLDTQMMPTNTTLGNDTTAGSTNVPVGTYTARDWLNQHSFLRAPIQLNLPTNNSPVFVAMRGAMVEPDSQDTHGNCEMYTSGTNFNTSFLIYGTTRLPSNPGSTFSLEPWVIATQRSDATGGFYAGSYLVPPQTLGVANPNPSTLRCKNNSILSSCSNKGLLQFELRFLSGGPFFNANAAIHYLGGLGAERITQGISGFNITGPYHFFYTPSEDFFSLDYTIASGSHDVHVEIHLGANVPYIEYWINSTNIHGTQNIAQDSDSNKYINLPSTAGSNPPVPSCNVNPCTNINLVITNLGEGFGDY